MSPLSHTADSLILYQKWLTCYDGLWRLLTGIFCHIPYTKYLKDRSGGPQAPTTVFPGFCSEETWFQEEMVQMMWICAASRERELYQMPRDQGRHLVNRSVVNLSLSTYGILSPASALAAWRWTGHIWKQVTLIKICLGMWEGENTNVLKSLYAGMLIQSPVA